jgi:DNA helicase-2/ATP-dependent DNA helicase PcrA
VLERVGRRRQWRVAELRRLANESSGRFDEFLDDVETLAAEARAGATTEQLLRVVRDTVGLGTALDTLDRGGRGPEASHRDDLNALISVARHASDPIEFEPWLRAALAEQVDEATVGQVTLSTVHRVKGMEWPHVVVLGAHDGLMPHHLADDVDEERRVFHVALTRTSATAHLVADEAARTRFVDELARPADPAELEREATLVAARQARPPAPARAPDSVSAADQGLFDALQAWRRERARADGVPAYVVLHDSHLRAIAAERPKSLVRLARCPGIGPTKLERYGDEIVAIVNDLSG